MHCGEGMADGWKERVFKCKDAVKSMRAGTQRHEVYLAYPHLFGFYVKRLQRNVNYQRDAWKPYEMYSRKP